MQGIIFDVDGTLWDSTEEVAVSWNQAVRDHTDLDIVLTGAMLKKEFGKPLEDIMESLFPMLTREEQNVLAAFLYRYENQWVNTAPCKIYEGMADTVTELSRRYKIYIVSNCQSGYIEAFLENTGLGPYITDYTCPGDTGKLKGENIEIIMKRNNITQAVYVGDTRGDFEACKEAGIPFVYAAYGFGDVDTDGPSVKSFRELLELDYESLA